MLRWDWLERNNKLELSWRYEDRNYSSITPSIGEKRKDERHRWQFTYEIPLGAQSSLQVYGGYGDYESNFPSADYDQNVLGSRFIYRWE